MRAHSLMEEGSRPQIWECSLSWGEPLQWGQDQHVASPLPPKPSPVWALHLWPRMEHEEP